jgi:hypothetical protein
LAEDSSQVFFCTSFTGPNLPWLKAEFSDASSLRHLPWLRVSSYVDLMAEYGIKLSDICLRFFTGPSLTEVRILRYLFFVSPALAAGVELRGPDGRVWDQGP